MRTADDLSLDELCTVVSLIHDALNGRIWSPETLDIIADILRDAGLQVAESA